MSNFYIPREPVVPARMSPMAERLVQRIRQARGL